MYRLAELKPLGDGRWRVVVTTDINKEVENSGVMTWTTSASTTDVMKRANKLVRKMNERFTSKTGKKSRSHWHSLAATGSKNDNVDVMRRMAEEDE